MSGQAGIKLGATKGKLILIAVLVMALVAVVASNFSGEVQSTELADSSVIAAVETSSDPADSIAPTGGPAGVEVAAAAGADPFGPFAADVIWPGFSVEEVAGFDPLAVPPWAGPPPPSDVGTGREFSDEQLSALHNAENAIILVSGGKRIALIGEQEFQVGDMIGGLRISDISSAGIVLSEPK